MLDECLKILDADHIAAIDDTVRYLLQKGNKGPLDVGFYFALGHSTVVTGLAKAGPPRINELKRIAQSSGGGVMRE